MLSYLLQQLFRSVGVFFRTIRAFFSRRLVGLTARVRRLFQFSRHATKAANAAFQGAASAVKKPSKREDYIETQRLFISKSFLILLAIFLVCGGLLVYFVVWPFVLSHFLTARFYQEDPRIETWSGRVIVYYDESKRIPRYSGTLVEGVLQGQGSAYDEAGLLCYQGDFSQGQYSGKGSSYEGGVLVYEGEFRAGLYEGTGSLYEEGTLVYRGGFSAGAADGLGCFYAEGVKRYEGAFRSGVWEGEGVEYYPSGAVAYRGAFSAGVREGIGTLFYEDGSRFYTGSFAGGLREGEGTVYTPEGTTAYKGGFSQDLYEGSGTLYLESGDWIQAEFSAGQPGGLIRWYRSGRLWYEGGADGLTPDGFGTIYGADGKIVYAGELDRGTLDGAWLLGRTAAEFRDLCGGTGLEEEDAGDGFWIGHAALGLRALCSYQQEDAPASVRQVWFQPPQGQYQVLLPWETEAEAARWAVEGGGAALEGRQLQYSYEGGYTCALLAGGTEAAPGGISWTGGADSDGSGNPAGSAGAAPEDPAVSQAQERLEALAAALDQMGGGSAGGVSRGKVERMVALMLTAGDAQSLLDSLADHLLYGQMAEALASERTLLERQAAQAQVALERGTGSQQAVESAQEALDSVTRRIANYETGRKQAAQTVAQLCGLDPADYDLHPVLWSFDPAELNLSALYREALDFAKEVSAGRYPVDPEELEDQLRGAVLDLGMSYENLLSLRRSLEGRIAALAELDAAYARGSAERSELYEAQCGLCERLVELYEETGRFTHLANSLNTLSGGWLSNRYRWLEVPLAEIFQGEIVRGQEAAAELERERLQREEEAGKALQEAQESPAPAEEPRESPPPTPTAPAEAEGG